MRLKAFSAPTMSLAMARVRETLGAEAVIVSTRTGDADGVIVTAAVEPAEAGRIADDAAQGNPFDLLDRALDFHRVPAALADPLREAAESLQSEDPVALLAGALDMHFGFRPLDVAALAGPVILMGPPGAGKTVAAAKIAAGALLAGKPVRLVTTDTGRAGGAARLEALAGRLDLPLAEAADRAALHARAAEAEGDILVVDTAGINPLDEDELRALGHLTGGMPAFRFLVMAAGADAFEAAEQATAFSALGTEAIIATRLDAALRYGGLLAAAGAARLPFAASGIRPQIGEGLAPLNPMPLARLLLARADGAPSPFDPCEPAT